MSCCEHCSATASFFDSRVAERERARYDRRGPRPTARGVIDAIRREPLAGRTLLDIGGGIGVVGCELLAAGLDRVTLVDAAPAYIEGARKLFADRDRMNRLETVPGNFVDLDVSRADFVSLDRVVCCYPDSEALLGRAARCAGRLLVMSVPRDRWYIRTLFSLMNLVERLRGSAFRVYVHSQAEMLATLQAAGLRRVDRTGGLFWVVEAYERSEG